MTLKTQRILALTAAAGLTLVFLAANLHLVLVASRSQPDCGLVAGAPAAARHSC